MKALTEQFDMLGVIHREYSKLKDKFGITGNPLNDPTEILSRVIEKNLKAIEDSAIEKVHIRGVPQICRICRARHISKK